LFLASRNLAILAAIALTKPRLIANDEVWRRDLTAQEQVRFDTLCFLISELDDAITERESFRRMAV